MTDREQAEALAEQMYEDAMHTKGGMRKGLRSYASALVAAWEELADLQRELGTALHDTHDWEGAIKRLEWKFRERFVALAQRDALMGVRRG